MTAILHLEDDPLDHKLVRIRLQDDGLDVKLDRVDTRDNFAAALATKSYDLILADYNVPSFTGLAAMRLAEELCPGTPFILVSGAVGELATVDALQSGVADYILKDHLDRLTPAVRRALASSGERAARRAAEQALRDSEERFRAAFANAAVGMTLTDTGGRFLQVNSAFCKITGYTDEELLKLDVTSITHPDDRHVSATRRREMIAGRFANYVIEKRYVRKDGSDVWVQNSISLSRDAAGWPSQVITLTEDVTERRRAEQEARTAREAAEAANLAKDHFLAVLSHELRTPLTPVLLAVSMLEGRADLPTDVRDEIATIRRSIELEARLIDDLLDVTRIAQGKLTLHAEDNDLHMLIRGVADMCCAESPAKPTLALGATHTVVRGDPARLQQVLWNLLSNAVKFSPSAAAVRVETRDGPAGRVQVIVSDQGIGITPTLLPRLFDAFEQGGDGTTRQFGGLGLGLAIARALVEAHGGTIVAASEGVNRGATFSIELPCAADRAPAPPSPAPSSSFNRATGDKLRVLLVEDHEPSRRALVRLLRAMGHDVSEAASVAAACEVAQTHPFDLLVSDLGLPDGTGNDVIRHLLAQRPALRGIALTGYGMDQDIRTSREAGFAEHLIKPVDVQRLENAIRRVVAA